MGSRNNRQRRQQQQAGLARRAGQQPRTVDPAAVIQQQLVQQQVHWQGPIPSPGDLEHYQRVDVELPNRILAMAERTLALTEKQTDHRIEMERRSILGMNWRANTGLWLAFALAVLIFVGCGLLIDRRHDAAGAAIASIDLVSLVGVFVYGRHDQRRQEEQRTE